MINVRILSIFLICQCLGFGRMAFADNSVVFACNEFPPYKMENNASGLPGFDVEFLGEAFKRVGISLEIQYMPWKRALEQARTGRVNGVCSCSKTRDREEYMYFSSPLGKASSGLFGLVKKDFTKLDTIDKIGNHSVGVIRGYNLLENLENAGVESIYELSSELQGLNLLLKGRIDYYYSYEAPTRFYLAQLKQSEEVYYNEFTVKDYYSCFSKAAERSEELLEKFNTGLSQIKNDGSYEKILAKYR